MRTRLTEWLKTNRTDGPRRTRVSLRVMYGVQVFHKGQWMNVCKGSVAQIFSSKAKAEALRAEMRQRKATAPRSPN